ncbi:MAG: hypothetical protein ACK5JO_03570 [Halodesulfovibrio sp.]
MPLHPLTCNPHKAGIIQRTATACGPILFRLQLLAPLQRTIRGVAFLFRAALFSIYRRCRLDSTANTARASAFQQA